ncbi:MAG: FAD-binding oxidoreductase [Thermoleophilia bacterium]|nr:FAD-binding oxidoreductase [Thermoleophilia bacterium]
MKIAVIGAGATGLAAASAAASLGAEVVVLEREYPASGSSSLSMGVYNRQTPNPIDLELRIRSIAELDRIAAAGDLPLERTGYVRLARSPEHVALLERAQARQRELGYLEAEIWAAATLAERIPGIETGDLSGGLYGPSDGTFDGHLICGAYLEEAERHGAVLKVKSALEAATITAEEIVLQTAREEIRCDRVINAAGAWAGAVGELLGAPVPLVPQRHCICVGKIEAGREQPLPIVNEYMPGSHDYALVVRPEGSDRLFAMLHSHEAVGDEAVDPDDYNRGVGFDYVELVAERLAARFPGLVEDIELEAGWAGLYPLSPDHLFQVGPSPGDPRLVTAAGVGGVGVTVSPAIGRLAAEWAVLGEGKSFAFAEQLLPSRASLGAAVRP